MEDTNIYICRGCGKPSQVSTSQNNPKNKYIKCQECKMYLSTTDFYNKQLRGYKNSRITLNPVTGTSKEELAELRVIELVSMDDTEIKTPDKKTVAHNAYPKKAGKVSNYDETGFEVTLKPNNSIGKKEPLKMGFTKNLMQTNIEDIANSLQDIRKRMNELENRQMELTNIYGGIKEEHEFMIQKMGFFCRALKNTPVFLVPDKPDNLIRYPEHKRDDTLYGHYSAQEKIKKIMNNDKQPPFIEIPTVEQVYGPASTESASVVAPSVRTSLPEGESIDDIFETGDV